MVVEYIRYRVPASRGEECERAWSDAQPALRDASQCQGHEVSRGVEEPEFFQAVKPFFEQIEEMRHDELTGIRSGG